MPRIDLSTLTPGTTLSGDACIAARTEKATRVGKPYLDVVLRNSTGTQTVRVWSDAMPPWAHIGVGDGVRVDGAVERGWKDAPELRVTRVERLAEDHPIRGELNPEGPESLEDLEVRLQRLVAAVVRPQARRLLDAVLEAHGTDFRSAPAAVGHHHNWLRGLLAHSVEVAEICLMLSRTPLVEAMVERSFLIVAALVHDIGKIRTYEWQGAPIGISPIGFGRSHITLGQELVRRVADPLVASGDVSRADVEHLVHCIESHHGKLEWGSPTEPASVEAHLLHLADLISSRIRPLVDKAATSSAGADHWVRATGWKDRPLYLHLSALEGESNAAATAEPERASMDAREPDKVRGPAPGGAEGAEDVTAGIPFDPPSAIRDQLVAAVRRQLTNGKGSSVVTMESVADLLEQLTAPSIGEPLLLTPNLCGYLVVVVRRHVERNVGRIDLEVADELRGLIAYLRDHTPAWMLRAIDAEPSGAIRADLRQAA